MFVQVNDLKIYYEVHGSGYPLILIHGGTSTINLNWEKCFPFFSKKFQVIALDSRGHGKTDNPKGKLSYQIMCDDIEAFIHALGIEKPVICGWSDGGQIALEIGIKFPTLANCLIVGGAYSELFDANLESLKILGIDKTGGINLDQLTNSLPDFVDKLIQSHSTVYGPEYWKELMKNLAILWTDASGFPKDRISQIKIPTLVINGDRDQFIPVEETIKLFRLIANAELAVVPNADHFLPLTHPEIFIGVVQDFCDRNNQ